MLIVKKKRATNNRREREAVVRRANKNRQRKKMDGTTSHGERTGVRISVWTRRKNAPEKSSVATSQKGIVDRNVGNFGSKVFSDVDLETKNGSRRMKTPMPRSVTV